MSRQDHLQIIKNTDFCEMAQSSYPYIHTLQHLIIIMQSDAIKTRSFFSKIYIYMSALVMETDI